MRLGDWLGWALPLFFGEGSIKSGHSDTQHDHGRSRNYCMKTGGEDTTGRGQNP